MTESLEDFLQRVRHRNPGQTEFAQAVEEVAESLLPFIAEHPHYQDHKILERMTEPDRVVSFRVTWLNDACEPQINRGYRVQFNNAIGPYKGGLRFHPTVSESVLKFLGFEQTFKNSLTGLPMGGGKGGSDFDPKGKSDAEVMRFCQSFMTELYRHVGASTDVPAGDIGVGAREIGYLFGQYKRLTNEYSGVLTGKGLSYGGSEGRKEATGYGVVYFVTEMLRRAGQDLSGRTCVVSGSGNVALYCMQKLISVGAKVVAFSDSSGFVHDASGLDLEKWEWLRALKEDRRGRVREYADHFGVEFFAGKRPWGIPTELAFPCATQNELEDGDAKALIDNGVVAVAEGANMPTSLDGIRRFHAAKVLFGPAKAVNAGGVACSGLEQSQNALRMSWSRDEVLERLHGIMRDIHAKCVAHGETPDGHVNYVDGANIAGFVKVADAMVAQGLV